MENDQVVQQPFRVPDVMTEEGSASREEVNANHVSGMDATLSTEIVKNVQLLVDEMQSLRHDFDTKVKYDESKERQINNLHQELQAYREGLHFKILRPVFIDLIAMHDDLGKLIESMKSEEHTVTFARTITNLESFQDTVEETLRRNGVERFSVDGDSFVPNKQRALQAIVTTDPTQH